MKHLEIGDGITWGKQYPKKSEEIHQLLEDNRYDMYVKTSKRDFVMKMHLNGMVDTG